MKMSRWKDWIEAVEDWLAGLLIAGGLGLIFIGVVMRYVFNAPLSFVEEYSGYMIVWGTMIGAVVALRDNHHIRVDMLYQILPQRFQKSVDLFANIMGLLFALFLFVFGIKGIFLDEFSVYRMNLVSIGQGVALWKIYLVMPLIGLLLTIRFIVRIVRLLKGLPESDIEHKDVEMK
jgi:C4-dicarboxylate transporter, DctQ subunit